MSRTCRRRRCFYAYAEALWDIDPKKWHDQSTHVRKRLAHFHGDNYRTWREPPPRKFRSPEQRRMRLINRALLRQWQRYPDRDLQFLDRSRCPAWRPL
jgi:hypothetical protein